MNNKSLLLYLVITFIFLLCVKNYLFKNNIESFDTNKCVSILNSP